RRVVAMYRTRSLDRRRQMLADTPGKVAGDGDVKLFLPPEMIGDGRHRLARGLGDGACAGAVKAITAEQIQRVHDQLIGGFGDRFRHRPPSSSFERISKDGASIRGQAQSHYMDASNSLIGTNANATELSATP